MSLIIFLICWAQAVAPGGGTTARPSNRGSTELDFAYFKEKVQPLFLEKRPGHARCVVCHSTSTGFRLQQLAPGAKDWSDEQSQKNFQAARSFVVPGNPRRSRLLMMPLAEEAGGIPFHPGGKHWESQDDPEWKALADWVNGAK